MKTATTKLHCHDCDQVFGTPDAEMQGVKFDMDEFDMDEFDGNPQDYISKETIDGKQGVAMVCPNCEAKNLLFGVSSS